MMKSILTWFSYLFFLKIFSKFIDFSLNTVVIRKIDKETYGLTMHYTILLNLALLLSKNCLARVYLKRTISASNYTSQEEYNNVLLKSSQNLMRLGFYTTAVIAPAMSLFWNYMYGHLNPRFDTVTWCVCAAILMESAVEIVICKSKLNLNYKIVASSEGITIFNRTIVLFGLTYFRIADPLVAFGLAQLAASLTLLVSSYIMCQRGDKLSIAEYFTVHKISSDPKIKYPLEIHPEMLVTCKKYTFIQMFKTIFTEKLFLLGSAMDVIYETLSSYLSNKIYKQLNAAAEYTLVVNLGSIVSRFIYAPLEELCFNFFGKLSQTEDEKREDTKNLKKREYFIVKNVFWMIHLIGLTLIVFAFNFSYGGLTILYGTNWSSETCIMALKTFTIHIYLTGINSITETYINSTIKEKEMNFYWGLVAANTVTYFCLCAFLVQYQAVGLILANIVSKAIRIAINLKYISSREGSAWNAKDTLWDSLPNKYTLLYLGFAFVVGRLITNAFPHNLLVHFVSGAVLMLGNAVVIFLSHRNQIMFMLRR